MSQLIPNGTVFAVSTVLAAAKTISAITNAAPPVATSAAHGMANGDVGLLSSGWLELNERVARLANQATNSFELEGFDTTSTTRFPTGQSAGTFSKVSTWVTLSQVREMSKSGGDQQFFQWRYLEDRSSRQRQRPTYKNSKVLTLTLDYDPALAWYNSLIALDAAKSLIVLRATLPNSSVIYYGVYPSFDEDPSFTMDENMGNIATFSQNSQLTRFDT